MTQVTLQFENNTIKNRLLKIIELMDGISVVETKSTKKKNTGLDKALEDVEAGRVTEYASVDDYFQKNGFDNVDARHRNAF